MNSVHNMHLMIYPDNFYMEAFGYSPHSHDWGLAPRRRSSRGGEKIEEIGICKREALANPNFLMIPQSQELYGI